MLLKRLKIGLNRIWRIVMWFNAHTLTTSPHSLFCFNDFDWGGLGIRIFDQGPITPD